MLDKQIMFFLQILIKQCNQSYQKHSTSPKKLELILMMVFIIFSFQIFCFYRERKKCHGDFSHGLQNFVGNYRIFVFIKLRLISRFVYYMHWQSELVRMAQFGVLFLFKKNFLRFKIAFFSLAYESNLFVYHMNRCSFFFAEYFSYNSRPE